MEATRKKLTELRADHRTKQGALRTKEEESQELKDKVDHYKLELEDKIKEAAEEERQEKVDKINDTYEERIEELKEEIDELEEELKLNNVDETEELVTARRRLEYLNASAIVVNRYYEELKKVSSAYFIDLAYTEKQYNLVGFKKQFKRMPQNIKSVKRMAEEHVHPFSLLQVGEADKHVNLKLYLGGFIASPYVGLALPYAIFKSIDRAKKLHGYAALYHRMMHTLVSLTENTDEEINRIFEDLLTLKSERIENALDAKRLELAELEDKVKSEIEGITFNDRELRTRLAMEFKSLEKSLERAEEEKEELELEINELAEEIEVLRVALIEKLKEEVSYYLQGIDADKRLVSTPERLLYMAGNERNSMFSLTPGLYIHNDREKVIAFIKTIVFQLRNIMKWGSVQFRIQDLLGAGFITPFMMPQTGKAKKQDIFTYTLSDERKDLIESMYDLLVRRQPQILSVGNIADYNILQDQKESAILPYQIVFMIIDGPLKLDEKLIQLIHTGQNVGLCFYIFVMEEYVTLQTVKTVESYFRTFVEITRTGITAISPDEYKEHLERKLADAKRNI